MKILAVLLAAVVLLGMLSGCKPTTPAVTDPGNSIGSTENPTTGSTDDTTEPDETTGTTAPATSGTQNTEPATKPTEPSTEPGTEPSTPSGETPEPTACAHKYGSWSTTKAATCSAAGSKERKCSACGDIQKETIAILSHTYGSWSTTKAAACDTNGTKTRICSSCGNKETDSITATGHIWDGGKVNTQPTGCSSMGIKTFTCKTCGKTRTEQIKGNHTFGDWKYEEYTYKQDGASRVSHRKVRSCTKCGYKEYGNTPDHYCARGSDNHKVTTVKEGTCTTKATMRSTCKVCGWYVEYEGKKGKCNWVDTKVHLSDYGSYTNELDATVSECKSCGQKTVSYHKGEGWSDYNRYRVKLNTSVGNAYAGAPTNDNLDYVDHPTWQMVKRDFKYDSDGYVKQYTQYWWYNSSRYSQVIKCGKGELEAWFAEYGLTGGDGVTYHLKVSGSKIVPHKVSWTS